MAIHAQTNCILTTKPAKTSLLGGHFIYRVDTAQGTLTPSSANIVQNASVNGQDVTNQPSQWGYNTHIGANGIKLRYNELDLSQWTNTGLTFYNPSTTSQGNRAMTLDSSNLTFYASDGITPQAIFGGTGAQVKGAITATSLTIDSDGTTYDGMAAINISGYDIEIEKNETDEIEGETVYLYPILYHNGERVPDTEIDYAHFVWYQDDDTIGTEGDGNNSGRYLATYGHNYRVVYDFDDGAVGGGTEVVDRTIDPSKYITKISDTGITIHPEVWSNQSSYIQLDGNGMELFNNSGNSIAQYGNTARVGLDNSSRFLINNNSLEGYDNNNNKYFEVNSNGLSWGSNTAATVSQFNTLNNYIDTHLAITSEGLVLSADNNTKVLIATGGTGHTYEDAGTYIIDSSNNVLAQFLGNSAQIGKSGDTHLEIDYHSLKMVDKEGNEYLHFSDLRNKDGSYTLHYIGDGSRIVFSVSPYGKYDGFVEVKIDGSVVAETDYEISDGSYGIESIDFYSAPEDMAEIEITYEPNDTFKEKIKAYTIGNRLDNSKIGINSVAIGVDVVASGSYSYAEGQKTIANVSTAHAEGIGSSASGLYSHAEGWNTLTEGNSAHAEGRGTTASGDYSHAEGYVTTASGYYSHAQNNHTNAGYQGQTTIGKYNDNQSNTAFEIGNGTSENARSNALTVDWFGNIWCAGGITATPTVITLTYSQCTTGSYSRCYRIGNMVFLSFNINVTTATASYDYITGLPPALGGGWATSSGFGSGAMTRWWVTTDGTLRADGTPTAGWHNGNIAYICE